MSAWGRDRRAGQWIPKGPRSAGFALLLAVLTVLGASRYTYVHWTPTQQRDVRAYARTTVIAALHLRPIYGGRLVVRLFARPLIAGGGVLIGLLPFAIWRDLRRARDRRDGRRLRGPERVGARAFSRRSLWTASRGVWSFLASWWRADGVSFQLAGGGRLTIPRVLESHHILITGDTGTGKSTLIENILDEVQRRGERAVVVDTKRRFAERYFNADRGDVIGNPGDARWRHWNIGQEIDSDDEAMSVAMAILPEDVRETTGGFFTKAPRRILAYLLTFRPDTHELVAWLKDGEALDALLIGSGLESILSGADGQRSGILAALSMVADTLQLCPPPDARAGQWTAKEWAATGTGWVFLTSTEATLDRLIPLQTLWADSIIMRIMQHAGAPITWVVEDEVAVMNRQPKLHTALTRSRESGLRMVIGFQARAQMEARYGKDAEAMLSQPATKVFLRTSEPHAAKWVSETIGDLETERLKQSRQDGWARSATTSYGLERHVEPLVMASQISGLPDLRGYIKIGNLVSPLHFPHVARPTLNPGLVRRPPVPVRVVPVIPSRVPLELLSATPHDAGGAQRME